MRKFIFGVMLLVSMLGIVGCANPSNFEDDPETDTYIVKNSTGYELFISYTNKSNAYVGRQKVPVNEICKIPVSDIKIEIIKYLGFDVPGSYLSIEGPIKEVRGITEESLKKGVQIEYYEGTTAYKIN